MAHNLSIRENGFVEFAFTGNRTDIWHGLGSQVLDTDPFDVWKDKAGMEWEVFESGVSFDAVNKMGIIEQQIVPDKKVLYRSDTLLPLSVVSKDFKVVQPVEVIEFFRDLISINNMKLSTAGTLFGGRKFWALAETGSENNFNNNDIYKGHLLLITSVDGSMSTTASFVSTRVVCNNTLNIALNEKGNKIIKKTHKTSFDPNQVKIDLGLMQESWNTFMDNIKRLSQREMDNKEVIKFFKSTLYTPKDEEEEPPKIITKKVDDLFALYNFGDGANLCKGTALGCLNAITNMFTHGTGRTNESAQFVTSYLGKGASIKQDAFENLLEMC